MRRHRCGETTRRMVELQQKSVVLELPYKWLRDDYGPTKLMRIQEEVEQLEEQMRREGRCLDCGCVQ